MVKWLGIFLVLTGSTFSQSEEGISFFMQLSKPAFFQGEQVIAQFIVESPKDRVIEVEVVKFPEFRGFWSENTILRQGPVPLGTLGNKPGRAQAIVGSYTLSSMIGYKNPTIEPMILLIKGVGPVPLNVPSNRMDVSPLPLPEVPAALKKLPFSGAVGRFSASLERMEIPFRKGQPFLIRAQLLGEGNFQEVNQIPLLFPEDFKLVSQAASNDSMAGRMRKIFDWVFTTESDQPREFELSGFLFFDPFQKKYEAVSLPTLKLVPVPEAKLPESKLNVHSLVLETESKWSTYSPLSQRKGFWLVQAVAALLLLAWMLRTQMLKRNAHRKTDPQFQKLIKKKRAHEALLKRDWSVFLPLAAELARSRLNELNKRPTSHPSVIGLKLLIEADNGLRFSHHKSLTVSADEIIQTWDRVSDDLLGSSQPP